MSKFQKIKVSLQKMLMNFGETPTDKGDLEYVGEVLEIGTEVFIDDVAAPDGEYETETRVIVVVDGVVTEIREKEVAPEPAPEEAPAEEIEAEEEAPVEEPAAPAEPEEPKLEDSLVEILKPLADEINTLKAELEAMKARMAEIEEKLLEDAAAPAEEEFKKNQKSGFFRAE